MQIVRKLAERTQHSLSDINATINIIVQSVNEASTLMRSNAQETSDLITISNEVDAKIEQISQVMQEVQVASGENTTTMISTSDTILELLDFLKQVSDAAHRNINSVDEIVISTNQLSHQTMKLNSQLDQFITMKAS